MKVYLNNLWILNDGTTVQYVNMTSFEQQYSEKEIWLKKSPVAKTNECFFLEISLPVPTRTT